MDINDLRRKRKKAAEDMKAKATALAALEAGTDADQETIDAAMSEYEAAKASFEAASLSVQRAEEVESALVASAASEVSTPAPAVPAPAQAINTDDVGADVGLMVAALANNRGDRDGASQQLEAAGHSGISAALSGATLGAGGVTIPRAQTQTIISLLQPQITVRRMGARVHDMPAGELRNARIASGPTAGYRGENSMIGASEVEFEPVDEKFKSLSSLVPIGNALLRHSSASVGAVVRDLMIEQMGLKADVAFLRYDGSGNMPKGLRHWAPAANWFTGIGNSVAAVETAINRAVSVVEDANVKMLKPGWIMRAATKNFLASLRDANGAKVWPEIDAKGELKGFPIAVTSQVPNNLGVGANETEVTFCDFAEIMIGESQQITIATSTEAAYINASGDTVSAFQNSLTLMRAEAEHDLAPMHDAAISGITGVGWALGL